MTTREQALRKRIEEMATANQNAQSGRPAIGNSHYLDFLVGANSLLPLLREMAEALDWVNYPEQDGRYLRLEHVAKETLASLDRFLSGGEGK